MGEAVADWDGLYYSQFQEDHVLGASERGQRLNFLGRYTALSLPHSR